MALRSAQMSSLWVTNVAIFWFISSDIASLTTRFASAEDATVVATSWLAAVAVAACAKSAALIAVVAGAFKKMVEVGRLPPNPLSKAKPSSGAEECVGSILLPLLLLAMGGDGAEPWASFS